MKKLAYILTLALAVCFAACEELPEQTAKDTYLTVGFSSKQLDSTKGSFFVEVDSNVEWSVSCSAEWLTTKKTSFSGPDNVMFSYTANEQSKSRTALIKVEPKEAGATSSHEIMITQRGGQSGGGVDDGGDLGGEDDGNGSGDNGSGDNGSGDNGSGDNGSGDNGSGDNGNDDGGNDNGGNDNGGNTGSGITSDTHTRWAELPAIVDADGNGRHDNDSSLYYTSHLCDGGEKNAQNNGKARNYTVCFSAEHHVPMWVAAPRHERYESGVSRQNNYKQDPTLPSDIQYYSKDTGGGCNKGHMLGSAERLSSRSANSQVMYFSNIAPQLSTGFNTGGGGWNTLEDWVDGQACADTLYQVIGCYFDRYTDGYGKTVSPKTIEFGGRNDVSMPTMFYCVLLRTKSGNTKKSVIDCSASELKCAAFVRSHTNDHKGQKVTRTEMMSVADLEKLTGFTYFVNVPNAPKSTLNPSDWGL